MSRYRAFKPRPKGAAAGPLRDVISIDEGGYYVRMTLACGHMTLQRPYKFKEHRPYPKRKRCDSCTAEAKSLATCRNPEHRGLA